MKIKLRAGMRENTLPTSNVAKVCSGIWVQEVRLSNCQYGCKVMRCDECGHEYVVHLAAYGHIQDWTVPVPR